MLQQQPHFTSKGSLFQHATLSHTKSIQSGRSDATLRKEKYTFEKRSEITVRFPIETGGVWVIMKMKEGLVSLHPDVGQHDAAKGHQEQPRRGHHCQNKRKQSNGAIWDNMCQFLLYRRESYSSIVKNQCSYLNWMSYTASQPVSPCRPGPATPGKSFCRQHPQGERWSLWRWDLCPRSLGSQTSWTQCLCRCRNKSTGKHK